jgi:hypothetical protein
LANLYDTLLSQYLNKQGKAIALVAVPSTALLAPIMKVQYYGSHAYYTVAAAAGGDLLFQHDDTDGTTTSDTSIGMDNAGTQQAGTIDLSTPDASMNTMGELVDWINDHVNIGTAVPNTAWHAIMNGALRARSTDNMIDTLAEVTSAKPTFVSLYPDMAVSPYTLGFSITNRRFTGLNTFTNDIGYLNSLDYLNVEVKATGGFTVNIYDVYDGATAGIIQNNVTETLLFSHKEADTTAVEFKFKAWGQPIQAEVGHRILVEVVGAAAVTFINTANALTEKIYALGTSVKVVS